MFREHRLEATTTCFPSLLDCLPQTGVWKSPVAPLSPGTSCPVQVATGARLVVATSVATVGVVDLPVTIVLLSPHHDPVIVVRLRISCRRSVERERNQDLLSGDRNPDLLSSHRRPAPATTWRNFYKRRLDHPDPIAILGLNPSHDEWAVLVGLCVGSN